MFRINFIQFLCLLAFCFSRSVSFSQNLFSNIYDHTDSHTDIELLYETDEHYYAIGRAQALGKQEIGLTVSCHDKKTGEVCESNIYTIEDEWIFTNGRTPVFQVDNALVFGACFNNVIIKLKYDLNSKSVSLLDSIVNPLSGGYYLCDMALVGDTTIYHAAVLQAEGINISSIIHKYPDGSTKHTYLANPPDLIYSGGRFIRKPNGNFIIFGSQYRKSQLYEIYLSIVEIDSMGNILREFKTPKTDLIFLTKDIKQINDHEVLVLTTGLAYDFLWEKNSFPNPIYKFDLNTWKTVWKKQYTEPHTSFNSPNATLIKGHLDDEYLYCTSVAAEGVTLDSFMTKARIVKIKSDGSKVWHKDYSYYNGDQKYNEFSTLIPTSDGNYIIGGSASSNVSKAWLLKINEDGDIVSIDTTSSAIDWSNADLSKNISIYPNPATDIIIINQGEISDVTYHIRDLKGTLIRTIHIKDSHHNVTWDISDIMSGTYIIEMVKDGARIGSKKVMVM